MLQHFTMRWTFSPATVRMWVDCERREAAVCVQDQTGLVLREYDMSAAEAAQVQTPEAASRWMRESVGERGSRLEYIAWQISHGMFTKAA